MTARGVLLALAFGAAMVGRAATPAVSENPETAPAPKLGDDELFTAEVFQSHLPTTLEKYGLRLSVNPHLGDWEGKDHMRVTTNGLRTIEHSGGLDAWLLGTSDMKLSDEAKRLKRRVVKAQDKRAAA